MHTDPIAKNLPENGLWHRLQAPAAWLRVQGEDAFDFLQGQFTQDLRSEEPNQLRYGLWLNEKGRVQADSFALVVGRRDIWLCSYFAPAAALRERLERFIVADDVVIEDHTADALMLTLGGEGAAEWLQAQIGELPVPGKFAASGTGFLFRGRRDTAETWEWIGPALPPPTGSREVSSGWLEQRRILAGISAVPQDIGPADLPNEGGLEAAALSYTKGCYLGQEVMARLRTGRVRRRLARVSGPGEPPADRPAPLFQGGKRVGELRSASAEATGGWRGLALLTLLGLEPGQPLAFAASAASDIRLLDAP